MICKSTCETWLYSIFEFIFTWSIKMYCKLKRADCIIQQTIWLAYEHHSCPTKVTPWTCTANMVLIPAVSVCVCWRCQLQVGMNIRGSSVVLPQCCADVSTATAVLTDSSPAGTAEMVLRIRESWSELSWQACSPPVHASTSLCHYCIVWIR